VEGVSSAVKISDLVTQCDKMQDDLRKAEVSHKIVDVF